MTRVSGHTAGILMQYQRINKQDLKPNVDILVASDAFPRLHMQHNL